MQLMRVTPGSTVPTQGAVYTVPSILKKQFIEPTSSTYLCSTPSSHKVCS